MTPTVQAAIVFVLSLLPFSVGFLLGYRQGFWKCFDSKGGVVLRAAPPGVAHYFFIALAVLTLSVALLVIGFSFGVASMKADWERCWEKVHVYS